MYYAKAQYIVEEKHAIVILCNLNYPFRDEMVMFCNLNYPFRDAMVMFCNLGYPQW